MRRFWLFRSNLKSLEYYHQYTNLEIFKQNCHDYYLLFPLWLLENDHFDEVTIWRLSHIKRPPITFKLDNGKLFIQRWCQNFSETLNYPSPNKSFFRGGFIEYDNVTKIRPKFFGKKFYLGAGRRVFSQWGGKYDVYLVEDEKDFSNKYKCIPFYKTASPYIFKPLDLEIKWDICWPCNFTQIRYKGQEEFISLISKSDFLKSLKIVHCGNMPHLGRELCKKYNITNIEFMGPITQPKLNKYLNMSKFGLNFSTQQDGCPRVSTEILMSGTPLILNDTVRLLDYFKKYGVVEVNIKNVVKKIQEGFEDYTNIKSDTMSGIKNGLSFDEINQKNIDLW